MSLPEKIVENIHFLPKSKQIELFDFVEYLTQKTEREENKTWSDLSITSAMRGMEDEKTTYTIDDLEEIY